MGQTSALKKPVLPEWARVLAGHCRRPRRMLELDYLHRAKNPLVHGSRLGSAGRSRTRSRATTGATRAADLAPFLVLLAPRPQKARNRYQVREEADARRARHHRRRVRGTARALRPEKVTAIVHTVAYANFHNRIVLALGVRASRPSRGRSR